MPERAVPDQTTIETPTLNSVSPVQLTHEDVIGRTPTAVVHRVSTNGSHDLAIKHPPMHGTLKTEVVDRFRNEAERWSKLATHENIVEVVDWDVTSLPWLHHNIELPWIAMEYMDGGDLTTYAGNLSVECVLWIAERLADAVWHAHHHGGGVIHHDLKPANILFRLTPDDQWPLPKISDWELARTLLNHSDSIGVTTPQYIAPEQARNAETNQWTDQFQLGIVFYELFTGGHPFIDNPQSAPEAALINAILENPPTKPTDVQTGLPSEIDTILQTMLAKEPSDRYEAMLQVRDALENITIGNRTEESIGTWPMFQANPGRTGHQDTTGPQDPVIERWKFDTGNPVRSSPAVTNNIVFIGSDRNLYAIDRAVGTEEWCFNPDGVVRSSPTVRGDTVYFGDTYNILYAVDANNGIERWRVDFDTFKYLDDSEGANHGVGSSPLVDSNTVYTKSNDGRIYAVNTETGSVSWKFDTESPVDSSPALVNDTLFVESDHGKLDLLEPNSGEKEWKFEIDSSDYYHFIPTNSKNQTGVSLVQRWDSSMGGSPAVINDVVYIRDHNVLYSINTNERTKQWGFKTDDWITSSTLLDKNIIFVGNSSGNLYALDANTGEKRWKVQLNGSIQSSPAVTDDTIYLGCCDGCIYGIDVTNGSKKWEFKTEDEVVSSPAVINNNLYIGSNDGYVYALSEE